MFIAQPAPSSDSIPIALVDAVVQHRRCTCHRNILHALCIVHFLLQLIIIKQAVGSDQTCPRPSATQTRPPKIGEDP